MLSQVYSHRLFLEGWDNGLDVAGRGMDDLLRDLECDSGQVFRGIVALGLFEESPAGIIHVPHYEMHVSGKVAVSHGAIDPVNRSLGVDALIQMRVGDHTDAVRSGYFLEEGFDDLADLGILRIVYPAAEVG